MTAFWSALAGATEVDIDGFKYLKLPSGKFLYEGSSVKDKLLVRKSYCDLSKLAKEYFDEGLEDPVYILRGNPGKPCWL